MQSSSELTYDDFEIEIGQGKGRDYPITVLHSEAGEARENMHFPYDELVLENRLLTLKIVLLESGGMRRTFLTHQEQTVQNFGRDLFNALITGEVRNRYDVSMEKARLKGRGLRVKLRIQPPNLAVLPWEFLYEPRQAEYMGLMRSISIVRYPEHPQPIQPLTVTLPLRILGMVASPKDLHPLDVDIEKQRVEEAIKNLQENGFVELTWLEGQTWRDLQKAMYGGPWHIFHFIGHGGFDQVRNEGIIALTDDEGWMRSFGATELSRLLADHQSLRLVILNSCEGAKGSERDLNSSTASILVRRGIPAVLAMQYKITDRAAIEFSRTFYDTLAYGLPVDAAVAEARKAISIEVANTVEWGTPVMYMRSPDGMLFSIQKQKKKGKKQEKVTKEAQLQAQKEAERVEQERREQEALQAELSALFSKGMEALAAQDWQTAIEQFKSLMALDASYKDVKDMLAKAEQQLEHAKKEEKQRLEEQEKEKARQQQLKDLYNKGKLDIKSQEWQAAIAAFQEVIALDSKYKDTANLLASSEAEQKRIEDAKKQEAQLAELYAKAVKANKDKNWKLVISTCQEILTLYPNYKDIASLLQLAQAEIKKQERKLVTLYSNAVKAQEAHDWDTVFTLCLEIQTIYPNYKNVTSLLQQAHAEMRRTQAEKEEEKARQEQLKSLYNKGKLAAKSQDWQTAIAAFQEVIALDSKYKDTANLLASAEVEWKKIEDAKKQEAQLAELYAKAVKANKDKNWTQVISICQEIRTIDLDYKDVATLFDAAQTNLLQQEKAAREEEERKEREKLEKKRREKELREKEAKKAEQMERREDVWENSKQIVDIKTTMYMKGRKEIEKSRFLGLGKKKELVFDLVEKEVVNQIEIRQNSIGMKFALIPAGEFMMGSKEFDWAKPVHKVTISKPFYLGVYPVTQREWKEVMGNNPSYFKGDNLPGEQISWYDVQEFIKKLNEKENTNKYSLPSEAEWEYAARAGTTTTYSFGDDESALGDYAWYAENSSSKTHDVGQKKSNPWGLYDMHGNVWEWVQDMYHYSYYDVPTDGSAWEKDGSYRVVRGGSWNYDAGHCRSAYRDSLDPGGRSRGLGFRLLRGL